MTGYLGWKVYDKRHVRRVWLDNRSGSIAALVGVWLLIASIAHAQTEKADRRHTDTEAATQRRINEVAAAVEQVRRTMLDETGLRKPGESLSEYIRRIALPLSSETARLYRQRIDHYLALIDAATQALNTEWFAHRPALRDTSEANQTLWKRLIRTQGFLSARVVKTRRAWHPQSTNQKFDQKIDPKFDQELDATFQLVITASDTLRDLRP